jgi:hypothetical protein
MAEYSKNLSDFIHTLNVFTLSGAIAISLHSRPKLANFEYSKVFEGIYSA